jgi:hypothetical protein
MSVSDDEMVSQLNRLGPEQVRTMLTRGDVPDDWDVRAVVQWLAVKDYEAERPKSDDDQETATAAGTLVDAVARANKKAAWALALAILSLILSGGVLVFLTTRQHGF